MNLRVFAALLIFIDKASVTGNSRPCIYKLDERVTQTAKQSLFNFTTDVKSGKAGVNRILAREPSLAPVPLFIISLSCSHVRWKYRLQWSRVLIIYLISLFYLLSLGLFSSMTTRPSFTLHQEQITKNFGLILAVSVIFPDPAISIYGNQ